MPLIISFYTGDRFLVGQMSINFNVALIMYYILGFLLMHFHTVLLGLLNGLQIPKPSVLLYVNAKLDIFIIICCSVINIQHFNRSAF